MSRCILVTGGAGYVGSHACKALAKAGYTPVTYDNLSGGHRWAVKWGPFEAGDLLDQSRLDEVIRRHRPTAVMHFAACAYVGESMENPAKYYSSNVAGTLSLLEAMRNHNVERIVFSSSCATYGIPDRVPITEDHPQNPINPYGTSKLMAERILADYHAAYGIKSISLRYFNAAGADPDGEIGECHDPETHLIPLVLDVALGRRPRVEVFGDDYDTEDGTCIRDYIHVTDLAEAHICALTHPDRDGAGAALAFNLGNGSGFSVRQVITAAERVTGRPIATKVAPRRAGDPPVLVSDSTRAQRELGWTPQLTELATIIETARIWALRPQK